MGLWPTHTDDLIRSSPLSPHLPPDGSGSSHTQPTMLPLWSPMRVAQWLVSTSASSLLLSVESYFLLFQLHARARRLQCGLPRSSSESALLRRLAGHVGDGLSGLTVADERCGDGHGPLLDGPPAAVSTSVSFLDARAGHDSATCRARMTRPGRVRQPRPCRPFAWFGTGAAQWLSSFPTEPYQQPCRYDGNGQGSYFAPRARGKIRCPAF